MRQRRCAFGRERSLFEDDRHGVAVVMLASRRCGLRLHDERGCTDIGGATDHVSKDAVRVMEGGLHGRERQANDMWNETRRLGLVPAGAARRARGPMAGGTVCSQHHMYRGSDLPGIAGG
jgi:hypothetical protein